MLGCSIYFAFHPQIPKVWLHLHPNISSSRTFSEALSASRYTQVPAFFLPGTCLSAILNLNRSRFWAGGPFLPHPICFGEMRVSSSQLGVVFVILPAAAAAYLTYLTYQPLTSRLFARFSLAGRYFVLTLFADETLVLIPAEVRCLPIWKTWPGQTRQAKPHVLYKIHTSNTMMAWNRPHPA
ncbi:hypothetical protein B0H63DRAFT_469146 [Podospora didyma]|uniref:Uncharacterized protein n=1 Tax=Podospora didyma TaxID=330526 RepID=A0AAE0NSX2_9PEZI|nr:hypothetical protein B0H63DRAFT_469146 [Podospora didyma]